MTTNVTTTQGAIYRTPVKDHKYRIRAREFWTREANRPENTPEQRAAYLEYADENVKLIEASNGYDINDELHAIDVIAARVVGEHRVKVPEYPYWPTFLSVWRDFDEYTLDERVAIARALLGMIYCVMHRSSKREAEFDKGYYYEEANHAAWLKLMKEEALIELDHLLMV